MEIILTPFISVVTFTFYFIYINTKTCLASERAFSNLHSTLFILIHDGSLFCISVNIFTFYFIYINTVYVYPPSSSFSSFTFYFIYINTELPTSREVFDRHLHSTLFILIPSLCLSKISLKYHLHSTLFILIHN